MTVPTYPLNRTRSLQPSHSTISLRLVGLIGFSLPISGPVVSLWIPFYPEQLSLVRLATVVALIWLVIGARRELLPTPSRRMVAIFACAFAYAALSVFWTADGAQGVLALVSLAAALLTGSVVLLLVRGDQRALAAFAGGVLVGALGQLLIALVEVRTGTHLTYQFGGTIFQDYGIRNIEALYGATAWGTLGNPNDLGGFKQK